MVVSPYATLPWPIKNKSVNLLGEFARPPLLPAPGPLTVSWQCKWSRQVPQMPTQDYLESHRSDATRWVSQMPAHNHSNLPRLSISSIHLCNSQACHLDSPGRASHTCRCVMVSPGSGTQTQLRATFTCFLVASEFNHPCQKSMPNTWRIDLQPFRHDLSQPVLDKNKNLPSAKAGQVYN